MKKIRETISLLIIKKPRGIILLSIIALNVLIILLSGLLINCLMRNTAGDMGFAQTIYYTIAMMLDAGMIESIVTDVGTTSFFLVVVCLIVIIVGSITFTGAVIGYVTNYISNFIENANSDSRKILISDHTVILNWNSRASEIINDMLYLQTKEKIIVLVNNNSERVKTEINERIYLSLQQEGIKNKLNIIVREGNTYSTKQLEDISLSTAKTVIILGEDDTDALCKYDVGERRLRDGGNANTIKTLVQVSEITSADDSADDQRIIVEVEDSWTKSIVDRIIDHKEKLGKCNIVSIPVNRILGQLLSQFCVFPELNKVYSELFSNKGAEFFCTDSDAENEDRERAEIEDILNGYSNLIPLSHLMSKTGKKLFFMSDQSENYSSRKADVAWNDIDAKINEDYWLEKRNVIILGHNSKINEIMSGFESFRNEWNKDESFEILNIMVIDARENLEKLDYFRSYSYINRVVEADIYDTDLIKDSINEFIDSNTEDTSVLILSDDMVPPHDIDSYALTNLIYVQDIIYDRLKKDPQFDKDRIDVIVEILNPKNYDVVHNYNIDNIVISNRYISKMVTQISEKIELFEFYTDILSYDDDGVDQYESKEIYVKPVSGFLKELPSECKTADLIRSIYNKTPADNRSIVIGIAHPGGKIDLFAKDQTSEVIKLGDKDKLILYSNH